VSSFGLQEGGFASSIRGRGEVPDAHSHDDDELGAGDYHCEDPEESEEEVDQEVPQRVVPRIKRVIKLTI
jgi:hypothetical protein